MNSPYEAPSPQTLSVRYDEEAAGAASASSRRIMGIAGLVPSLLLIAIALFVLEGGLMIIVIVVLLLVRDSEQVSIAWVGLALLVGALSAIAIEMTMLLRVRQPLNVATPPSTDDGPRSS